MFNQFNKLFRRRSKKKGLPPGSLVYTGEKKDEKIKIHVIDYDEHNLHEKDLDAIGQCFPYRDTQTITWINIDGIHNVDLIQNLGAHFNFHPLILEDVVTIGQRPKIEIFDDHIFIVLKMLSYDDKNNEVMSEQVSIIFGKNYAISFQESSEWDVFDAIRHRLRAAKGKIRKQGSDYLAYSLVDAIVDNYFVILEKIGERTELMEEELLSDPKPKTLQKIHKLKREVIFLRKSVWPLRELINTIDREEESDLIHDSTKIYFKDVYDHTIQIIDAVETLRDILSEMIDIYLSSMSNRLNNVMKVLTIIATIFMPLTFIVGLYGMNFEYMPELKWKWGYFIVWGVIVVVTVYMILYFKKKKWL